VRSIKGDINHSIIEVNDSIVHTYHPIVDPTTVFATPGTLS
jgi:hypothetical protein